MRGGSICSVHGCMNYAYQKNSKSLFRFPRDAESCKNWIQALRRKDLLQLLKEKGSLHLYAAYRICSIHFEEKSFRNPLQHSQGLFRGTCPTLYLGVPNDPLPFIPAAQLLEASSNAAQQVRQVQETGQGTAAVIKPTLLGPSFENIESKQASKCAVSVCNNVKWQKDSKTFYKFPSDLERCKKWIQVCDQKNLGDFLEEKGIDYFRLRRSICSVHFEDQCFRNPKERQVILNGANPTLHLGTPSLRCIPEKRLLEHTLFHDYEAVPQEYYHETTLEALETIPPDPFERSFWTTRRTCSMSDCDNYSSQAPKSFYRFPRDPEICAKWVQLCRQPHLEDLLRVNGPNYLHRSYKICSRHFPWKSFKNPSLHSQGIFHGALPTLNLGNGITGESLECSPEKRPRDFSPQPAGVLPVLSLGNGIPDEPLECSPEKRPRDYSSLPAQQEPVKEIRPCLVYRETYVGELELKAKEIKLKLHRAQKLASRYRILTNKMRAEKRAAKASAHKCKTLPEMFGPEEVNYQYLFSHMMLRQQKEGLRYAEPQRQFALALQYSSPKAYQFLQTALCLPTERSLRKWLTTGVRATPGPGINDFVLKMLKTRSQLHSSDAEKLVTIVFDEMELKEIDDPGDVRTDEGDVDVRTDEGDVDVRTDEGDGDVRTDEGDVDVRTGDGDVDVRTDEGDGDIRTDEGEGDVEMGENNIDHIIQSLLLGVDDDNASTPLCTEGSSSGKQGVVFMIRGVQKKFEQVIGYYVTNNGVSGEELKAMLLEVFQKVTETGYIPKAVVCDQGIGHVKVRKELGLTPDSPVYNFEGNNIFFFYDSSHLLRSVRHNLKKYNFQHGDSQYSWKFIDEFHEKDASVKMRLVPTLTRKHVDLPAFKPMSVSLATDVFSRSVATAMHAHISSGALPGSASHTAKFLSKMGSLYENFNATDFSTNVSVKNWEFLDRMRNIFINTHAVGKPKSSQPPCFTGWVANIAALKLLCEEVEQSYNVRFFSTQHLMQDRVERVISVMKCKGGPSKIPHTSTFQSSVRSAMSSQLHIPHLDNNWEMSLESFLSRYKGTEA